MKKSIEALALVFAAGLLYGAGSVDGIAVSSVQAPCAGNEDARYYFGSIVKYTIENDAVARCDTIYKQHFAGFPVLNVRGTHCAFIRKDISPSDTAVANDNHKYISVMDLGGGGVRDVDTLPARHNLWTENACLVEWPAGDYIYYTRHSPSDYLYSPSNGKLIDTLYRVKYNDPSSKSKIFTYAGLGTFALSLDATRSSITSWSCQSGDRYFCTIPYAFPPTSEPQKGDWTGEVSFGCGAYLSPSGKYHTHFPDGGHGSFKINGWNPPYELVSSVVVDGWNDFPAWSGLPRETVGGGPMEYPRWAVNSDKWICACTKNASGAHNQLLVNWADHKAICTSVNTTPLPGTNCAGQNDPGDFWVAGGPGGDTYEDINGNWVTVDGTRAERFEKGIGEHRRGMTRSGVAAVHDLRGMRVGSFYAGECDGARKRVIGSGVYFVSGQDGYTKVSIFSPGRQKGRRGTP